MEQEQKIVLSNIKFIELDDKEDEAPIQLKITGFDEPLPKVAKIISNETDT